MTKRYFDWIESESARTGQPGLNLEQISKFLLPMPSIEEQTKIAEALSDVDALIAALDKKITKKRLIKQGAMIRLLGGQGKNVGTKKIKNIVLIKKVIC